MKLTEYLADISILYTDKIYLEDSQLKIDKASPFRSIYIEDAEKGKQCVGDPFLRAVEIEYLEEHCQEWILAQMIQDKVSKD
tara:strand:+ start:359 stop:604 length:246 start_codon:yes stop_codon:yes gene_type:complete